MHNAPTGKERSVLIVDDQPDNQTILHDFILTLGHKPLVFSNGLEVLAWLSKGWGDLILLDIMMPVMDGVEVLRRIKLDSRLSRIPVIIISAFDDKQRIMQCLEMGADDFLTKPFDSELLRARISGALKRAAMLDEAEQLHDCMASCLQERATAPLVNDERLTAAVVSLSTESPNLLANDLQLVSAPAENFHIQPVNQIHIGVKSRSLKLRIWPFGVTVVCLVIFAMIGWFRAHQSERVNPAAPQAPLSHVMATTLFDPKHPGDSVNKLGTIHVLAIGVSDYSNSTSATLPCAANDAREFAETVSRAATAGIYTRHSSRTLENNSATRRQILFELNRIRQNSTQHDLAVISFAGHGVKDESGNFYFAPFEFDWSSEPWDTGVAWDDIKRQIAPLPCHVILVMDTCHSGAITKDIPRGDEDAEFSRAIRRVAQGFRDSEKGVTVIAASLSEQYARERQEWGHSALTLALLECLQGKRLYGVNKITALPSEEVGSGVVTLSDVDRYVTARVRELTSGRQAVVTRDGGGNLDRASIPLAIRVSATNGSP